MELFNKYKNKNFTFLTNYINSCINDESLALSPTELRNALVGTSQSTYEEFLIALTNTTNNSDDYDASLLFEVNNTMQPIRQVPIPIRATIAEKAWLYYVLQDCKSDLFLNSTLKAKLLAILERDISKNDYSIKSNYIDVRSLSPYNQLNITKIYIENFKMIVDAIRNHRYLNITNNSFEGTIYKNQKIIPYKLEYSSQFDSFSLSCFPLDVQRPVKMNLKNISEVEINEPVSNYHTFISDFEKQLKSTLEKEPLTIEISNKDEAYDRTAYLFSAYNTFCYDLGNDKLQMNIYYYRFQKDEIIRNILFLGPYVKILSPKNIADEVISVIKSSYSNYQ